MIVYQENVVTFVKCKVLTAVKIKMSGMWHPVVWYIGTNVLEGFAAFICRVKE